MNHPLVWRPYLYLFLVKHQVRKARHCKLQNYQKFEKIGVRKYPLSNLLYSFSLFIFTISYVFCCHRYFLWFKTLWNKFMYGCYSTYTDIYIYIYFNILCYAFYHPKKNCEILDLEFRYTFEVCVNHNIDSWWTTHWNVNTIYF